MRNRVLLAAACGLAAASLGPVGAPTKPAFASCVAPTIVLRPATGAAGARVVIEGKYFSDRCNDVIVNGEQPPPAQPVKNIQITFQQGTRVWNLGSVDARDDQAHSFSFATTVPIDAKRGAGAFAAGEWRADFTVTALPAAPVRRQPSVTG